MQPQVCTSLCSFLTTVRQERLSLSEEQASLVRSRSTREGHHQLFERLQVDHLCCSLRAQCVTGGVANSETVAHCHETVKHGFLGLPAILLYYTSCPPRFEIFSFDNMTWTYKSCKSSWDSCPIVTYYRQPLLYSHAYALNFPSILSNMKWFFRPLLALVVLVNVSKALPSTPHYHTVHINPAPFRRWPTWLSTLDERADPKSMGTTS